MTNQNLTSESENQDHLITNHPDGTVTKIAIPKKPNSVLRIGRELDNEVTLTDLRSSRYHAKIRRTAIGGIEISDVGSINGTTVGAVRLNLNEWYPLSAGQIIQIGDTKISWEKMLSSQATIGMVPVSGPKVSSPIKAKKENPPYLMWIGGAVLVLLLLIIGWYMFFSGPSQSVASATATTAAGGPADIAQQTPEGASAGVQDPTQTTDEGIQQPVEDTPTSAPRLPAKPSIILQDMYFLPVISGALFDPNHVYLIVSVRVENLGDEPFIVSTGQFFIQTDKGETLTELGQGFAKSEFARLGVTDRFDDLNLGAGGSVSEQLIFYLDPTLYNLTLFFQPEDINPSALGLGTISAGQELSALLGTPTAEPVVIAEVTATPEPTVTPTEQPVAVSSSPRTVSSNSLAGTIAFADFNGSSYDLYFGNVATGDVTFWRGESSQPTFSNSGQRIAYHSWANNSRGLITSNLDHSNGFLVATFLEDQLPTWSPDDSKILFLSRRTGGRQSQLYLVPSNQERPEAQLILEGEHPIWHNSDSIVFKGWVSSGTGLRISQGSNISDYQPLTDHDGDTAPSISPDGTKIAFMSNRNGNWDIYIVNRDGSGITQLTVDEAQDGLPTWSPDGEALAFVSNRGGPWAIWAMTPSGTGIRQLFTYKGSPDGFVASEPNTDTTRGWAEERISWTATIY